LTHRELALVLSRDRNRIREAEEYHRQSLAMLEKLAADFPKDLQYAEQAGHSQRYLGWLLAETGRLPDAEAAFRSAVSIFEKLSASPPAPFQRHMLADTHLHLGNVLRNTKRPIEAEKAYRQALAIHEKLVAEFPKEASYRQALLGDYIALGYFLSSIGKTRDAEKAYRKLLELDPKNPVAHNNLAWLLAACADPKLRKPGEAVDLGKNTVELEPKAGIYWNTLGAAHYRAGNWKDAIAAINKSLEFRKGGDSFDWFFVAMACRQQDKKELAGKWFEQAVQWMEKNNPKNEELLRFRAEAAALLARSEQASPESRQAQLGKLEIYSLIIETDPAAGWAYLARSELYVGLKEWDKAAAGFAKAIELGADDVLAVWYPLALLHLRAGRTNEYRCLCESLLARFSQTDNPAIACWVVITCKLAPEAVADLARPVQIAEKLSGRDPKNAEWMGILGDTLYRKGDLAAAVQRLEASIGGNPGVGVHWRRLFLAMAYHRLGRAAEAQQNLRKAIEWTDKNAQEKLGEGAELREPLPWPQRLDLQLLRREAEQLLGVNEKK
jgi:tetratricopeptide (TPR) repeat protein